MASSSATQLFFFFIIITTTHILFVSAINSPNPDEFYPKHPHHIPKVAGMDDREQDESLFLIKFRTFLGLTNSHTKNEAPSPSPSPAPTPLYPPPPVHEVPIPIPEQDLRRRMKGGGIKTMVVAIIISSAFIFMLSVISLILFCQKYLGRRRRRRKKTSTTTTIIISTEEEGGIKTVPTKMVTNQSIDLLYINSLQTSSEPHHPFPSLKHTHDQIRSDSNLGSHSSAAEIISIHDSAESEKYESDTAEKLEASSEAHSSESSRSFHSSSSMRLSPPPPPPPPPPPSRLTVSRYPVSSSSMSNQKSEINMISSALSPPPPPPPPCPPPLGNRRLKKLASPPPPSQLNKDRTRLPKLKPLHWDKVRAAPHRSTVWDKLRGSSFELDEEMIESLFGYQLKDPNKASFDEARGSSPNYHTKKKHVLEPKRLHNITILSKAVNTTADQVCAALVKGEGLCLQQLEALTKMTLTKEEEAKLSGYKGDINELSSAEHFVKRILNIPLAFHRIESMLYKETFNDETILLQKSFSMRRMGLDLVSSLSVELHNVKKTATIDLEVLAMSMRNLLDGMDRVRNLVEERLGKDEMSVEFMKLMAAFLRGAEKNVEELRVVEDEVLSSVGEITEYFHGDVNKVDEGNPLRIFVIVRDFLGTLSQVCRELRTSNSNNPFSTFR